MIYHVIFLLYILFVEVIANVKHFNSENERRKVKIVFMSIGIFLFGALRSISVGTDIESYASEFHNYISVTSFKGILNYDYRDKGFSTFCWILGRFSNNPQILLVTISLIVSICFGFFVYYTKSNPILVFGLFITFRIYSFTLSGLRQAVSMSILWIAYFCLNKKKYIQFAILLVLATLFHLSSIIFIIVVLLNKIKKPSILLIAVIVIVVEELISRFYFTGIINKLVFSGRFTGYINNALVAEHDFSLTYVLYLLMFIVSFYWFFIRKKNTNNFVNNIIKLSIVGLMFSTLGRSFPDMFRIGYYFILYLFPLFSCFLENAFNKKVTHFLIYGIYIVMAVQYLVLGTGAGTEKYFLFWN